MKVVTAVVNNPVFIEIQYYTLQKYMKCDYEFIVFNDAKRFADYSNGGDETIANKIEEVCKMLGIPCHNIPNEHHRTETDAAERCADAMNYILKYQLENPDKYLIIDSDMFLIDDYNGTEYAAYDCAIVMQERKDIRYFWNGLAYFDIPKMKNKEKLNWSTAYRCDVGGAMQEWLQLQTSSFPLVKDIRYDTSKSHHCDGIYYIRHLNSTSWDDSEMPECVRVKKLSEFLRSDPRNKNGKFISEIYDNKFFHYLAGGNWNREGMVLHNDLTEKLKNCLFSE